MPAHAGSKPFGNGKMGKMALPGKTRHGPFNAGNRGGNTGKFSKLPGRMNHNPMRTGNRPMFNSGPRHFGGGMGGGRFSQALPRARRAVVRRWVRWRRVWWRPFVRRWRLRTALTESFKQGKAGQSTSSARFSFETG